MRLSLPNPGQLFVAGYAERTLVFGVATAFAFAAILYGASRYEHVLTIDRGVGLYQNYGLLSALVGDAVLLYLARKYFDLAETIGEKFDSSVNHEFRALYAEFNKDMRLQTRMKGAFLLFTFIGICFVAANISLQLAGDTVAHWKSDVFDSPSHPASCIANKVFMLYSWGFVLPYCGYAAIVTSLFLTRAAKIVDSDRRIKYDLLNPDNAGGFSYIFASKVYFNTALSIVYLQVTLLTITFSTRNLEHDFGYIVATLLLLFGNFFVFHNIDRTIERKRVQALDEAKEKTYQGDGLNFEIIKYHVFVFATNSFSKRISRALISIKIVAVIIPAALRITLLVTS